MGRHSWDRFQVHRNVAAASGSKRPAKAGTHSRGPEAAVGAPLVGTPQVTPPAGYKTLNGAPLIQAKNRSVDKSPNYWYTGDVAGKSVYPGKQPTIIYRFTRGKPKALLDKILGWPSS